MHELAVCQSLIAEVERVSADHGAASVAVITVAVGPLSGVEGKLLARAFSIARAGTAAENAELEIEAVPVVVRCAACDADTIVVPNRLLCGTCGGWQVELKSGDELLLKRVELARVAEPASVAG